MLLRDVNGSVHLNVTSFDKLNVLSKPEIFWVLLLSVIVFWLKLSWTFEKEGTKLEWRWKCKPSHDSKKITVGILDFLMEANIRLSV